MNEMTKADRDYLQLVIRLGERRTIQRLAAEIDARKERAMKKKEPKWLGETAWMVVITERALDGEWRQMCSGSIYRSRRQAIKYKPDVRPYGGRARVVRVKIVPVAAQIGTKTGGTSGKK